MKKKTERLEKYCMLVTFFALMIIMFITQMAINNTSLYYDDSLYWCLGRAENWSVMAMSIGFRGYVLPGIFSVCYKVGEWLGGEFYGYRIFASVIFAFLHTYLLERTVKLVIPDTEDISRIRMAIVGTFSALISFIFFKGLYIYTLIRETYFAKATRYIAIKGSCRV